jgi:Fungal Zn(2)-Cys(6) binuclear cluster domain
VLIQLLSAGDLRDRHRRRCEKSIDKIRVPKKKSCGACGRSKVKCNLQTPACERCRKRKLACVYSSDTVIVSQLASAVEDAYPPSVITDPLLMPNSDPNAGFHPSLSDDPILSTSEPIEDATDTVLDDTAMDDIMTMAWNSAEFNEPSSDLWNTAHLQNVSNMATDATLSSTLGVHTLHLPAPDDQYAQINHANGNQGIPISAGSDIVRRQNTARDSRRPAAIGNSPSPSEKQPAFFHENNHTRSSFQDYFSSIQDGSQQPHMSGNASGSASSPSLTSQPDPRHLSPDDSPSVPSTQAKSYTSGNQLSKSQGKQGSESIQASLLDVEEAARVLCDYPKQMLNQEFSSPFVHHRYYRCSEAELTEAYAVALCCVSANLSATKSSLPFVCGIINEQRERLVNEFVCRTTLHF